MIELIPAIDVIEGKCVRLSQGKYESKKVYNENPLDVAKDLDGAASHHIVNYRTLEELSTHTSLVIDFGGGVKSDEDLRIAFECGARLVTGGSIAVKNPDRFCHWLQKYGPERIILGADVKEGRIAVNGWKEESACELFPFLDDYLSKGVTQAICTDVGRDGMLQGPSLELYKEILRRHPSLYLVASGGVGSLQDVEALEEAGLPAVIIGKAFYEGRITLEDMEKVIINGIDGRNHWH